MSTLDGLRSSTAKLVVLYLRQVGDATPREIADSLDLRLLTVLTTLRLLDDERVVERLDGSERVVLADGVGDGALLPTAERHVPG
ncbi:MAG: hypothetical protein ABEH47_00045 [Haloferacaceae archaeon]